MGKNRDVSCAELVLDIETKTQRVILKKKVYFCSFSCSVSRVLIEHSTLGNNISSGFIYLFICLGAW